LTTIVYLAWLLAFIWLGGAAITFLALVRQKFLQPTSDTRLTNADAPLVSVLLPARDEEQRILAECVRSILAQDYGSFELLAIDDRSTDATLHILRELARNDTRLRVIQGRELPDDWLGKPNALQQGFEFSRGEWILTTDADVILHPSALRTTLDYALRYECDAVSFAPHFEAHTFWERVFIPTWAWGMLVFFPFDWLNRRKSRVGIGFGAYFLVRRASLERLGGFACVRDEVVEDVRLAEKLKHAGAHLRVEYAPRLVRTRMYTNFSELWESATKNLFAVLKFSLALAFAYLFWTFAVGILPVILLAASVLAPLLGFDEGAWRQMFLPSLVACAVYVATFAIVCARFGVSPLYSLTGPLGYTVACAVLIDSTFGVLTGRGVTWKGRKIYGRAGVRPPRR
jgi:chlorobactene glucosyltransferase